jgi:hypothetical protein
MAVQSLAAGDPSEIGGYRLRGRLGPLSLEPGSAACSCAGNAFRETQPDGASAFVRAG